MCLPFSFIVALYGGSAAVATRNGCKWEWCPYRKRASTFAAALAERGIAFPRYGYNYAQFVRIVNAFRDGYSLESFTYKQLDKFLWSLGDTLPLRANA
jgi:hypothetical protein